METAAVRLNRSVVKLARELGSSWTVVVNTKNLVDSFKATMPLIADLRNPAMRERHWDALIQEVGTAIDPNSDSFTLETAIQLRLDLLAEFISELSGSASKEMAIEQSIQV